MMNDANVDYCVNALAKMRGMLGMDGTIRMLALGYTDVRLSRAAVDAVTKSAPMPQDICETGTRPSRQPGAEAVVVIDPTSFFRAFGYEVTFIDLFYIHAKSIPNAHNLDLNEPLPAAFSEAYDLVLDGGTTEHCFNVPQVMANIVTSVRLGGVVNHGNPLFSMNHGFYNFSPIFYEQFYGSNGFTMLELNCCQHLNGRLVTWPVPATSRELLMLGERGEDYFINAFCRRDTRVLPVKWPVQA